MKRASKTKEEKGHISQINSAEKDIYPLNTIFYGPPGTGKTYYTINRSVAIIAHSSELEIIKKYPKDERNGLKQEFEIYKEAGQIAFVTFHQAFSYEDFVEGIKPYTDEHKNLVYRVEDGIFKQLSIRATYALYLARQQRLSQNTKRWTDFDALYIEFVDFLKRMMSDEEAKEFIFETVTEKPVHLEQINNHHTLIFRHEQGARTYGVTKNRLEKLYNRFEQLEDIKNVTADIINTIGGCNTAVYWATFSRLKDFEQNRKPAYEYIYSKGKPAPGDPYEIMKKTVADFDFAKLTPTDFAQAENYVLIIDEINRGNIASIFGELITLLEDDKRAGKQEALSVILPYSKDSFSVPPNLFLLGTMNSADRSIEVLDSALRRRFSFEEMPPRPELLNSGEQVLVHLKKNYSTIEEEPEIYLNEAQPLYGFLGAKQAIAGNLVESYRQNNAKAIRQNLKKLSFTGINLEQLLAVINRRITLLLDADHCIGHAFFMPVFQAEQPLEMLNKIFYTRIIPLLQEYFYGDYGKVELIIGKAFFGYTGLPSDFNPNEFFADSTYDTEMLEEFGTRKNYQLKHLTDVAFQQAVIKIYHK